MATAPLTVDQFAKSIKDKYPQYAQVPDASLVEAIVAKYPQYKSRLGGAAPTTPSAPADARQSFADRVVSRLGQSAEGAARMPSDIITEARRRYDARRGKESGPLNAAHSAFEATYEKGVAPLAQGIGSVTTPALIGRVASKEDPAAIAADMGAMMLPGGEDLAKATHGPLRSPTEAGPLLGSMSRAKQGMDFVDSRAQGIPINVESAYKWAQKAVELGRRGFTLPKPITDFISWIDSAAKPGMEAVPGQPRSFVDRATNAKVEMPYEVARDFEQSLGAKIPWDADPGGKMNGLMKQMRQSLGSDVATGLRPYGLDTHYIRSKANFEKAFGAQGKYGIYGKLLGKVAGYGGGGAVGHSLILGHLGGQAGESLAGSLVRSVTEAGGRERPVASMRSVANPVRDTAILDAVRRERPDWTLSQQLMEAARRANPR